MSSWEDDVRKVEEAFFMVNTKHTFDMLLQECIGASVEERHGILFVKNVDLLASGSAIT